MLLTSWMRLKGSVTMTLGRVGKWKIAFGLLACASVQLSAVSAATITALRVAYDVNDFSSAGLGIGSLGYWFANAGAESPTGNVAVAQNAVSSLPSWLAVDFNPLSPTYSFPADNLDGKPYAVSTGGEPTLNTFTLPDGSNKLSGQLVDVRMAAGGTDTLVKDLTFGAGSPASILFHVIVDNAPLAAGTSLNRVRATYRLPEDGNTIRRAMWDGAEIQNNGIADVYTFKLEGIEPTGYLALQLGAVGSNTAAGMAGFAFDPVPEPSTATLVIAGLLMAALQTRRRW